SIPTPHSGRLLLRHQPGFSRPSAAATGTSLSHDGSPALHCKKQLDRTGSGGPVVLDEGAPGAAIHPSSLAHDQFPRLAGRRIRRPPRMSFRLPGAKQFVGSADEFGVAAHVDRAEAFAAALIGVPETNHHV